LFDAEYADGRPKAPGLRKGNNKGIAVIRYADDGAPRTHERRLPHVAMRELPSMRCGAGDEGRPLGAVWQEEAPNHRKLRWSPARGVSVEAKAGQDPVR
jgi:hypothetical protein